LDLATSVVPYLALLVAMTFALRVSVLLSLVLVLPTSAFLIRTFIVFHDCTHGSFMRSRRANDILGAALGLLVWLPYRGWQRAPTCSCRGQYSSSAAQSESGCSMCSTSSKTPTGKRTPTGATTTLRSREART